jgi:uncharacterized membrane protein YtjA (UPF0391 family)
MFVPERNRKTARSGALGELVSLKAGHPTSGEWHAYLGAHLCGALVAGVFGFGGVASAAAGVARILFFIFIVVFLVTLILALL